MQKKKMFLVIAPFCYDPAKVHFIDEDGHKINTKIEILNFGLVDVQGSVSSQDFYFETENGEIFGYVDMLGYHFYCTHYDKTARMLIADFINEEEADDKGIVMRYFSDVLLTQEWCNSDVFPAENHDAIGNILFTFRLTETHNFHITVQVDNSKTVVVESNYDDTFLN